MISQHLKFEMFPKLKCSYAFAIKFVALSPKQRLTKAARVSIIVYNKFQNLQFRGTM